MVSAVGGLVEVGAGLHLVVGAGLELGLEAAVEGVTQRAPFLCKPGFAEELSVELLVWAEALLRALVLAIVRVEESLVQLVRGPLFLGAFEGKPVAT